MQVYVLLRRMVDNIANSEDVRALKRYPTLRREIVTAAYRSLEQFKVGGRACVRHSQPAGRLAFGPAGVCQAVGDEW